LFFWECDPENKNEHMHFVMPTEDSDAGYVRLAADQSRCWMIGDSEGADHEAPKAQMVVGPCRIRTDEDGDRNGTDLVQQNSTFVLVQLKEDFLPSLPTQLSVISWANSPTRCLDVMGGIVHNGNGLQLFECADHPDMQFLTPAPGKIGQVRWAAHPDFCLDCRRKGGIFLWKCQDANSNMMFTMPKEGKGYIHPMNYPHRCLSASIPENATRYLKVEVGPCDASTGHLFIRTMVRNIEARNAVVSDDTWWGAWSPFGACSATRCGRSGRRTRTRAALQAIWEWSAEGTLKKCADQGGPRETKPCRAPPCSSGISDPSSHVKEVRDAERELPKVFAHHGNVTVLNTQDEELRGDDNAHQLDRLYRGGFVGLAVLIAVSTYAWMRSRTSPRRHSSYSPAPIAHGSGPEHLLEVHVPDAGRDW
jgi:hypothetical protein